MTTFLAVSKERNVRFQFRLRIMKSELEAPLMIVIRYTGLGRHPYGGRHIGSCPPSGPHLKARGWSSTTFAHCKPTNFICIIAYDCCRNPSSAKLDIFPYCCPQNVLFRFS